MRSTAENAELALLLEAAATPKPGNVDRLRDHPDLRFEQFLAGAVGARAGLGRAAAGEPIGAAFEAAVRGMSRQSGGNTQFGAVLLLTPLVSAAGGAGLDPAVAARTVGETTVDDAAGFYRAFDHVDVTVGEPPADWAALDVRRGSEAVAALRERDLTLADVMERSADRDGIAAEYVGGFERTFDAAERLLAATGPVTDRAALVFLEALSDAPDTSLVAKHGRETAADVQRRAEAALAGDVDPNELADELVDRGINPGTTADIVAGGLFVALERGLEV